MVGEGEEFGGDKSGSILMEDRLQGKKWFKMRLEVLSTVLCNVAWFSGTVTIVLSILQG